MKEIQLTQGKVALVDDEDFEWLNQWKWHIHSLGYACRTTLKSEGKKTVILMHRVIFGLVQNESFHSVIDHINGNKIDNRKSNIRVCNQSKNNMNKGMAPNNKSGYKGVSWSNHRNSWVSFIKVDGKNKNLGSFTTKEEAHKAYQSAAKILHGEFANFGSGCVVLKDNDVSR